MNLISMNASIPKSIKAACICALFSILGFTITKYFSGVKDQHMDISPTVTKVLKFQDHQDGSVIVIDATDNQIIDIVTGEAGFIRGVLRTVTRERKMRGIGNDEPMQLSAYNDGRLILQDPLTNTKIELKSFGSSNVQEFRAFLTKNNKS